MAAVDPIPNELLIVSLTDSWASLAGGIQTVNRNLCRALVERIRYQRLQLTRVICLAVSTTPEDEEEAKSSGVTLLAAQEVTTHPTDPRVLTMMYHDSLKSAARAIVIGHAKFTGMAAVALSRRLRESIQSKAAVFVHMDPEETEDSKDAWDIVLTETPDVDRIVSARELRTALEDGICLESDVVFAVGPRLRRALTDRLRKSGTGKVPEIVELLCGMDRPAAAHDFPLRPVILTFGRADQARIKGVDLFVDLAGLLTKEWNTDPALSEQPSPRFIIRGAPPNTVDASQKRWRDQAELVARRTVHLAVRPYTSSVAEVAADIRGASLVIIPSRVEGFGLAAVEAVSLGVPVVVPRSSGLGELIADLLPPDVNRSLYLCDPTGNRDDCLRELADACFAHLRDPQLSHFSVQRLREVLWPRCAWTACANTLLYRLVDEYALELRTSPQQPTAGSSPASDTAVDARGAVLRALRLSPADVLGNALIELRDTRWPNLDVSTELVLSKLNEIRLLYQDLQDGGGAVGSMKRAEQLAIFLGGLTYVGYPVHELSASNFAKFFDKHPLAVCVAMEALIKARCDALFFQQPLPKFSRLGLNRSGEEALIEPPLCQDE